MHSTILYERILANGPAVRIRVVSPPGAERVKAVLEIDRRTSTAHATSRGMPPRLVEVAGGSVREVLGLLQPYASNDAVIGRLLAEKGIG